MAKGVERGIVDASSYFSQSSFRLSRANSLEKGMYQSYPSQLYRMVEK